MRIAISGKCRSGKDTVADMIISKIGGEWIRLSFAAALYKCVSGIQTTLGFPEVKDGLLLQAIGEGLRKHYGENVWVDIIKRYIDLHPLENIIITDLRYRNELKMLKENGFVVIRINRKDRPVDRDPNHISEIDLDYVKFEHTIDNNSQIKDLCDKIDELLDKL